MNIQCIKDAVLNGPPFTLKSVFSKYVNPLLQGTNLDISDLRLEYYDDFEQQDSSEFVRFLLSSDYAQQVAALCQFEYGSNTMY